MVIRRRTPRTLILPPASVWLWAFAIFLLPFVGALAYLLMGGAQLGSRTRLVAVGGGAAIYALVLVVGSSLGGIS